MLKDFDKDTYSITVHMLTINKCFIPNLVSLLLTLNIFTPCSNVSIVNFEQVNADWVCF